MSRRTSLEERVEIVKMVEAGKTDKEIAAATGWCERTVFKWRRREQILGRSGLGSDYGRPQRGAMSSHASQVRQQVLAWRQAHPGWGAGTLHAELKRSLEFAGRKLPSRAAIGRLLQEQGLSRRYEQHRPLPEPKHEEVKRPHQVWEMDARGHGYVPEVGVVALVHLNDCATHLRLLSYPVWVGAQRASRHPDTADYQTVLRLAFTDWGLPERLQLDHDSVFVDNLSKSPFPSRLHLWLAALGVDLAFIRPLRPTDQGMTERSHQLWAAQCLQGQSFASWNDLYAALHQRRDFLNQDLPCASLDHKPPLVAFPDASHSARPYRPEWEADLLDLSRVWAYLAQGRWFRQTSKDFTFSLGGQVYYIGRPHHHTQLDITFDPADCHLLCHDQAGQLLARLPIHGLSIQTLMGDLFAYMRLPSFQLALPFAWSDLRLARLFETLPARLIET
jgi:transposase